MQSKRRDEFGAVNRLFSIGRHHSCTASGHGPDLRILVVGMKKFLGGGVRDNDTRIIMKLLYSSYSSMKYSTFVLLAFFVLVYFYANKDFPPADILFQGRK